MQDDNRGLGQPPQCFGDQVVLADHKGGRAFGTKDQVAWGVGKLWGVVDAGQSTRHHPARGVHFAEGQRAEGGHSLDMSANM